MSQPDPTATVPRSTTGASRGRKWALRALKTIVILLVVWFVRGTLAKAWHQLGRQSLQIQPGWLAAAGAIYLLGLLPAAVFWGRVLRAMGQEVGWWDVFRAYYIGHLGKYVPGKAMVVILRAGLVRGTRAATSLAAASVFYETLSMMAVGACLAAGALALRLRDQHALVLLALGLMAASGLPTLPPVFRRLARWAGVGRSDKTLHDRLDRIGLAVLLEGWIAMTLSWLALALSLWATLRAMGMASCDLAAHWTDYLACVTLSMVAGFASLIPGGLGVRDGILLSLLSRLLTLGALQATAASALLRLVWLVAELVGSAILYAAGRWRAGSSPGAAAPSAPGGALAVPSAPPHAPEARPKPSEPPAPAGAPARPTHPGTSP